MENSKFKALVIGATGATGRYFLRKNKIYYLKKRGFEIFDGI